MHYDTHIFGFHIFFMDFIDFSAFGLVQSDRPMISVYKIVAGADTVIGLTGGHSERGAQCRVEGREWEAVSPSLGKTFFESRHPN